MRHFLLTLISTLFAATLVAAGFPIAPIYKDVHEDFCTDMMLPRCPGLTDPDLQWGFVAVWCEQHQASSACTGVKNLAGGPAVIAFNHDTKQWRVVRGVDPNDVEQDANGVPKIRTGTGTKIVAVVESTNPLLYVAEAGAITETNSPAIANLQALFDLLGPAIAKNVALAGGNGALEKGEIDLIDDVKTALAPLKCIPDQWSRAADFITQVEKRGPGQYTLLADRTDCGSISAASFANSLATLQAKVLPLRTADFCSANATGLLEVLDMDPANPKAIRTKLDALQLTGNNCRNRLGSVRQVVENGLQALESATAPADIAAARRRWDTFGTRSQEPLRQRAGAAAEATKLVTAADELLGTKKDDTKKALEQIEQFEQRLIASVATDATTAPKSPITQPDVVDFIVVEGGTIPVVWEKVRARTLTVKKSSPFSDKVFARRPDSVASSYSGESLTASLIDMSVALTFTQMSSPVFGAVASPTADNAARKVIAQTAEEERSGALALMVGYPIYRRSLGVEVGVGTDSDNAALFAGLSWRIRGFHLGFGSTWQQVTALDGQKEGDVVTSKDDIKTKNELGSSWYASFSFSLGSLSLFKKD